MKLSWEQRFPIKLTTAELKLRGDLCAVDGILYDLDGFRKVHPGGVTIGGAGAYDASALFHSMHPGRVALQSELLQGYKIGEHVRDASSDDDMIYTYDSPFAVDLRRAVRSAMAGKSW